MVTAFPDTSLLMIVMTQSFVLGNGVGHVTEMGPAVQSQRIIPSVIRTSVLPVTLRVDAAAVRRPRFPNSTASHAAKCAAHVVRLVPGAGTGRFVYGIPPKRLAISRRPSLRHSECRPR